MNTPSWLIVADFIDEHGFSDVANEMRRIAHGRVYVVTTGEYSDYSVKGVFLSPEAAKACYDELAKMPYEHPNDVDEYVLDSLAKHVAELSWETTIGIDGEIKNRRERLEFTEATSRAEVVEEHSGHTVYREPYWQGNPSYAYMARPYLTVRSYVSQGHADKVAIEQYQMRLIDGRWPPADHKPEPDHEFVPTDSGKCGACGQVFSHWKHWEK